MALPRPLPRFPQQQPQATAPQGQMAARGPARAQPQAAPVGAPQVSPMMSAAMGATSARPMATTKPGLKQGVGANPLVQGAIANNPAMQGSLGGAQGSKPPLQSAAAPQQPNEIDQLFNDIKGLNEQGRQDILNQGRDNFSSMQRAAMGAAGRLGGVGGAVLSTQGDMLRQATKGMSDALAANTGQRQQIMGDYMNNKWQDSRLQQNRDWDVQDREAGAQAEREGQSWSTKLNTSQQSFATQMDRLGLGNPNIEGGVKDENAMRLYGAIQEAKSPQELATAEKNLQDYLNDHQKQYEDFLKNTPYNKLTKQQKKDYENIYGAAPGSGTVTDRAASALKKSLGKK